ncbi:hypothetical protein ZIOFF_037643 [Zingiber officinale]|uniref:Protein kinase domain-containing protein n=1 Tax=Zingiber officinale TaxID=94328 RepID=A0A8J5GR47_ZINOF|nr:hypothetical protein ZIOFF_037643 [Zingiber officinale]
MVGNWSTSPSAGQDRRRDREDRSYHCARSDRTAAAAGLRSHRPGRLRWPWSRLAPLLRSPSRLRPFLDKRALSKTRSRAGLSKAAEDAFVDLVRVDAARLVRIRHPGVLHVVQVLDESKNAIAMVTEPIFASVANALGQLDNISRAPK